MRCELHCGVYTALVSAHLQFVPRKPHQRRLFAEAAEYTAVARVERTIVMVVVPLPAVVVAQNPASPGFEPRRQQLGSDCPVIIRAVKLTDIMHQSRDDHVVDVIARYLLRELGRVHAVVKNVTPVR